MWIAFFVKIVISMGKKLEKKSIENQTNLKLKFVKRFLKSRKNIRFYLNWCLFGPNQAFQYLNFWFAKWRRLVFFWLLQGIVFYKDKIPKNAINFQKPSSLPKNHTNQINNILFNPNKRYSKKHSNQRKSLNYITTVINIITAVIDTKMMPFLYWFHTKLTLYWFKERVCGFWWLLYSILNCRWLTFLDSNFVVCFIWFESQ
jgi:hypothetical protein